MSKRRIQDSEQCIVNFMPFSLFLCFFKWVSANLGSQGTSILGNLLHWGENKQQQNYLETGFRWVIALSGSGILYMQGDKFAAYVFLPLLNCYMRT